MTKLWNNDRFIADRFVAVDDASPLPHGAPVIVSLKRWRAARADVLALGVSIGVLLEPTSVLSAETDALDTLALIVIPFAKFSDGRGYSQARRLRDQFDFHGEIRATGEVLLDQIALMQRCGIDGFAVSHAPTLRDLEAGRLSVVPEVYQNAVYGRARTTRGFVSRPLRAAAE